MKLLNSSLVLVFALGGCAEDRNIDKPQTSNRQLNVAAPMEFIHEHFKDEFTGDGGEYALDTSSIDESGTIALVRDTNDYSLRYELITVSRHGQRFDIGVNSSPMTLQEAKDTSLAMCKIIGIDSGKLRSWFEFESFKDAIDPTCLQIGQVNDLHHSVSVRRSFNSENQWRVLYELSFANEQASRETGPNQ